MDLDERIDNALVVLGNNAKIVKAGKHKRHSYESNHPRKVSSFIKGTCKQSQSAKAIYVQCKKKVRYKSQHEARLSGNKVEHVFNKKMYVYRCPICNGWHLASKKV